jgi:carbon monoxide dehydrogenase subunit G
MKTEVTVTIRRMPEEVFPFITDPENAPNWAPVKEMRQLSEGPINVGTKFVQVITFMGQSFKSATEITAYDEPTAFAFKSTSGPVPFEQRFLLSASEGGTKLEVILEGEPGGLFKLAQPLLKPTMEKQLHDQINKLKQLLEQ